MHYSIFPIKTAWISSGSNDTTGTTERDQNFGRDEILELKKEFFNLSFDYPTRMLLKFDLNEVDIGDSLKISKIQLPEDVQTTIRDRDFVVATIVAPTIEVEEEKPEEEGEEAEGVEGAEGGEGAEGVEGVEGESKEEKSQDKDKKEDKKEEPAENKSK